MKQLNIAIIGQGRSGRDIHGAYLLTATDKYKVKYVVEKLEHRRALAVKEYGCTALSDYTELFDKTDVDFVVNASTSQYHYPITADLLKHGFNVLVEKPFAKTASQVDELIKISNETGKMLAIFQQSRFAPYFEQVKKVINSGVLGDLIQVSAYFNGYARRWDWQCCQCFNAGSLYNTGPHPVDQVLNILDDYDNMPNIFSKLDRVNTFGDAEDYVKIILTAKEKPLIDLEISSCDAYPSFTYNIKGSRGGLKANMEQINWKYFKLEEAPKQVLIKEPLQDEKGNPKYCGEQLKWYEEEWSTKDIGTFTYATEKLYDTVYNHLVHGADLIVTPKQVRQQIAIMEQVHIQNPLSVME